MTQKKDILSFLLAGNTLSPREAMLHGWGMKLPTRISELKRDGWKISDTWEEEGKYNFKRYWIDKAMNETTTF